MIFKYFTSKKSVLKEPVDVRKFHLTYILPLFKHLICLQSILPALEHFTYIQATYLQSYVLHWLPVSLCLRKCPQFHILIDGQKKLKKAWLPTMRINELGRCVCDEKWKRGEEMRMWTCESGMAMHQNRTYISTIPIYFNSRPMD